MRVAALLSVTSPNGVPIRAYVVRLGGIRSRDAGARSGVAGYGGVVPAGKAALDGRR
jgi:hypothetical protein